MLAFVCSNTLIDTKWSVVWDGRHMRSWQMVGCGRRGKDDVASVMLNVDVEPSTKSHVSQTKTNTRKCWTWVVKFVAHYIVPVTRHCQVWCSLYTLYYHMPRHLLPYIHGMSFSIMEISHLVRHLNSFLIHAHVLTSLVLKFEFHFWHSCFLVGASPSILPAQIIHVDPCELLCQLVLLICTY